MKSRVHSVLSRLAKTAARKALVIVAVASLVIVTAGMGVWTREAYAAKAKAEAVAVKQAATLNDVMAKLNKIESEMRQETAALKTKIESVEYQNAKLAVYEVRQHADTARLELAAERMPMYSAMAGQLSPTLTIPMELETEVCAHGGLDASAKLALEGELGVKGEGEIGAEAFANGAAVSLEGGITGSLPLDVGGSAGLESNTCLKLAKFNIFGSSPTVNEQQFLDSITIGGAALADKLTQVFNSLPQLANSAATSTLDTLQNFSAGLSPQQFLANLDDPQAAFQNVSNVISAIPLPPALSNLFQNPSSLFPTASDFSLQNICANARGGLISNACSLVNGSVAGITGIQNTIAQFTNVQGDLANFKTSLSGLCNGVNGVVSGLSNASITVPQLASFQLPTGLTVTNTVDIPVPFGSINIPDGFGLATRTVGIGPQTIASPFHLQPVPCSN